MKQIRKRLTYANVMSSIAVFLILGGGAAIAALGKNTVGTKQLKKNAVKESKVADSAVTSRKIADGNVASADLADAAVTLAKLAANSVDGTKVVDASLNTGELANAAVTLAKLAGNSVDASKVVNGSLLAPDAASYSGTFQWDPANVDNTCTFLDFNVAGATGVNLNDAIVVVTPTSAFGEFLTIHGEASSGLGQAQIKLCDPGINGDPGLTTFAYAVFNR